MSEPAEYRPDPSEIQYRWTYDGSNRTGDSITIGPVDRQDNGARVTCTANEQGSTQTSQHSVHLDVQCKF